MPRRPQKEKRRAARDSAKPKTSAKAAPRGRRPGASPAEHDIRLIVGLGASAGGLEAFSRFLANMPPRSGMAFVLVQHLDPVHKSLLVELLAKHTEMPVTQAEDGMAVAADRIFVIPPNAVLTIKAGILHVSTPAPPREHRRPIDMFFASLAEDQGENAVCIILSGSGSDGSVGLKAVKEHGGLALAQAGFDETALLGMPSSAAATGLVDEILPVEQMPARLLAYQRHLGSVGDRKAPDGTRHDAAEHLTKICALLRARLGHDFSEYKKSTLIRRIQRRMQVLQIDDVPAYIDLLRDEPAQLDLLFHDLLIGVTQFFRDPTAFAALESSVIPALLEGKRGGDQLRIWVAGCATGEEAYSIAILVKEAMIKLEVAPKVQIFATDLDEKAVAIARHGRYRKDLLGVSAERLDRWFAEEGDDYCVVKEIREMCIYSTHNIARHPPFSRLDLISCRNLLIYFDVPLQSRLVRTFHYALRRDGYLFLGGSEGLSRQGGLFDTLDKKHRIFQRRDDVGKAPTIDLLGSAPEHRSRAPRQSAGLAGSEIDESARRALERYSPTYMIVDRQHDVLRFAGRTSHYVEHSTGAASLNLFDILRKELLSTVRTAVRDASATRRPVISEDVVVLSDGGSKVVTLVVEPLLPRAGPELYVVAFVDRGTAARADASGGTVQTGDSLVALVEKELEATRAQLRSTIDDLESANEELKSANEEYQSVNEEFQSANEELESSKEELQSINEELHTINGELTAKNETLTSINSDIKNLLDSTQIAALFLDKDLRIRNFTPAISEIFRLRAGDRGRPITEIATHLSYAELMRDVKKVLHSLSMLEREVSYEEPGATFLMRIRPYRTVSDVIDGVVITFVDVSERKRHEEERARLAAIVESSDDAIISSAVDGTILTWNDGAQRLFGYGTTEIIGKPIVTLYPPERSAEASEILARIQAGERTTHYDTLRRRKDGSTVEISLTVSPIKTREGTVVGAAEIAQDITTRKHGDELRALMADELNHRVKNTLATVQSIAAQSFKTASDVQSREAFDARLVALSRTHDMLARDNWESASLRELLLQELEPYGTDEHGRFALEGSDIALWPKAALALGLTFHELATNAAKYGALSRPQGQVRVTWDVVRQSERTLRLRWTETGGPPVKPTDRKGFGLTLIERGLTHEIDGAVRLEFARSGIVCTIKIPLRQRTGR